MVKEIEANLCFAIFGKKLKISKWPPYVGRGKLFENCLDYIAQISCGSKINEIALSRTIFLKIAKNTLVSYLIGRKFRRNRSILHG